MKAFYGKRALELRYAKKETVDIDILTTSRSSDSQNHAIYQSNK